MAGLLSGLTLSADEALAETHAQTQEEDRSYAAHRQEDDHGGTHCGTQTHPDSPQNCAFKRQLVTRQHVGETILPVN